MRARDRNWQRVLLASDLIEPLAAAAMVSVMIVAAVSVHWQHGLFAQQNGIELPLIFGVVAAALALTGPGAYSVDPLLGPNGALDAGSRSRRARGRCRRRHRQPRAAEDAPVTVAA